MSKSENVTWPQRGAYRWSKTTSETGINKNRKVIGTIFVVNVTRLANKPAGQFAGRKQACQTAIRGGTKGDGSDSDKRRKYPIHPFQLTLSLTHS